MRNQRAPLRRDTTSPFGRPHSRQRTASMSEQPPARRRAAVPGLLVRHAHDLEQAERPRPFREQPSRVQRDRDAALHVGHARPVAALAVSTERPCGGSALREDGVVMAEQRDARGARPAQGGVEREPARRLHELGIEPIALGLERENARQPVEGLEVAARACRRRPTWRGRRAGGRARRSARSCTRAASEAAIAGMSNYGVRPNDARRSTSAGSTICPSRPT